MVTGTGNYTTTGTGTGSEVATQVGLYYWNVSYSGNAFDTSVSHSGQTDTAEQLTTIKATPALTTQGNETAGGVVGAAVLSDTATLSGGYMVAAGSPAPTITFTLIAPNGSTAYTETQTVTGTGNYTTTGTGTGSEVATQVGTYYWNVSYSGNTFNGSVNHGGQGDSKEQLTTAKAVPAINTTAGGSVIFGSGIKLSDTANLTGGYGTLGGSITFTLYSPTNVLVYTDVVPVNGAGTYTTNNSGTPAGGNLPTATGSYMWHASYSGDSNNIPAQDNGQNETETVGTSSPPPLGKGMTATIGFWKNRGQQVITSIPGTALGDWLATNWPNLFAGFAGKSSTFVASAFQNGSTNTYLQAFAVALDVYFDTTSLGGATIVGDGLAAKYGFLVTKSGGGNATWNIGGDGAALGAANNSNLTLYQILAAANQNYNPTTGQFYGGDPTLTDQLNTTLNGINEKADIALTAGEASSGSDGSVLINYKSDLHVGTITVAVDALQGPAAAAEQARIDDAIASLNASLAGDGVLLVDVGTDTTDSAAIHIHLSDTSVIGDAAQGVLGVTQFGGEITLITGWNYYLGSDPSAIGAGQYDFETVVTHELGHALGLGHSPDTASVMFPYLDTTQVRRQLTNADLTAIATAESGPEPLMAAAAGYAGKHNPGCNCPACQAAARLLAQAATHHPALPAATDPTTQVAVGPGATTTPTGKLVSAIGVGTDPLALRATGTSPVVNLVPVMHAAGTVVPPGSDPADAMLGVWVG
jgi:hypothetical protein